VTSIGNGAFNSCESLTYILTEESNLNALRELLPDELKQKVTTKEIATSIDKVKHDHLDLLLKDPSINPLYVYGASKELIQEENIPEQTVSQKQDDPKTTLRDLPNDVWYEINKRMIEAIPIYQKLKKSLDELPLPKNTNELADYKKNCKALLTTHTEKREFSQALMKKARNDFSLFRSKREEATPAEKPASKKPGKGK